MNCEPGATAEVVRPPPASLCGARVLVVDDIGINRLIFSEQLSAEGAMVIQACSGPEALLLVEASQNRQPFDLVLLDHMMPDMTGEHVAARIRAEASWKQLSLILASSLGALTTVGQKAVFDAQLTKPVRHSDLLDSVSRALCRAPPAARATETLVEVHQPAGAGRILLAEDHEINRFLAVTLLQSAGYTVGAAINGVEALALARHNVFDLILMDVHMPLMDGLEASRELRALGDAAPQPPIIALTANAQASDREACLLAGMDDFIGKPFKPEQFLDTVSLNITGPNPSGDDGRS